MARAARRRCGARAALRQLLGHRAGRPALDLPRLHRGRRRGSSTPGPTTSMPRPGGTRRPLPGTPWSAASTPAGGRRRAARAVRGPDDRRRRPSATCGSSRPGGTAGANTWTRGAGIPSRRAPAARDRAARTGDDRLRGSRRRRRSRSATPGCVPTRARAVQRRRDRSVVRLELDGPPRDPGRRWSTTAGATGCCCSAASATPPSTTSGSCPSTDGSVRCAAQARRNASAPTPLAAREPAVRVEGREQRVVRIVERASSSRGWLGAPRQSTRSAVIGIPTSSRCSRAAMSTQVRSRSMPGRPSR